MNTSSVTKLHLKAWNLLDLCLELGGYVFFPDGYFNSNLLDCS